MEILSKGFIPANTRKNTMWAWRVFAEWRAERNKNPENDPCPMDLFENPDIPRLNNWLARFIAEVRRQDGNPYPPKTIHQILAALQWKMLDEHPDFPKFLDSKQWVYHDFIRTCDSVYHELHSQGVGTDVRHTPTFTSDDKDTLWEAGVLGDTSPKSLQRAVFFYIGKHFCIRGGDEQRSLGPSQFLYSENPDWFTYVEYGSKNNSGGLAQLRKENKCVHCYSLPSKAPRCLVHLLDLYLSKLPQYAFQKDIFYCWPKLKTPVEGPWYDTVAVGHNKLSYTVKEMCEEANIAPRTNHSLRATGATALFHANVPERIIQKTTGHHSLNSLRTYERISTEQQQAVSCIMMSNQPAFQDQPNTESNQPTVSSAAGSSMGRLFGDFN